MSSLIHSTEKPKGRRLALCILVPGHSDAGLGDAAQLRNSTEVESKVVGPIGPSTVRSIKRLVRFSRKPLSSVAPRSEFAVWRQVAASFVPRLGLSLRELSKFTISPRFPSLAHSRLSTGTSPSNGPFGPASAAARSNDPRPYVCRLVPEYYSPIRFLTPRRPEFRSRLYPHLPRRALGRCLSSRLPALSSAGATSSRPYLPLGRYQASLGHSRLFSTVSPAHTLVRWGGTKCAFAPIVRARPFPIFGRPVHPRDRSLRLRPGGSPHALQTPPRGGRPALQSFRRWLQLCLVRVRLSPSCPFRHLPYLPTLRPVRHYPHLLDIDPWPRAERDFNPPETRAARHALCPRSDGTRCCRLDRVRRTSWSVEMFPPTQSPAFRLSQ